MILFTTANAILVDTGMKTATRRRGKRRWKEGAIHKCYMKLPLSGGKPFARVRIDRVYEQELGEMTAKEAQKEGWYTLSEFRRLWREIHGAWRPNEKVWAIEFTKVGDAGSRRKP